MINFVQELFSYGFIIRAFIAGSLIALCAALLGVILVLKRYSMIGDGLSHVGFGTMAIAMAFNFAPLAVSIPICVLAAFLLLRVSSSSNIKGDAAIALISSSSLAIGILVTSLTSGLNTDVTSFMFGSILAISKADLIVSVILAVVVVSLFVIFYNKIFLVTFDENFATASGIKANLYNGLIAVLTALTIVIGMRLMGAMMISSLIVFPALSAMRIFRSFFKVIICAVIISLVCFIVGIISSFVWSTPAGASIIVANLIAFVICMVVGKCVR
ncbi:MAG: metal ABC transporter permease [Treponema sp.]|jgi:zinc transport system permease protein|nr:metal ABC transporter permease [Treponema sp.]MBQ5631884.1 metal ABC transporter permease [Treponema sp.]